MSPDYSVIDKSDEMLMLSHKKNETLNIGLYKTNKFIYQFIFTIAILICIF